MGHYMDSLSLTLHGPLRFLDNPSILGDPPALECGVYFWTVPCRENEYIYYVGETGNSFSNRMLQHLQLYFSGSYRIYDPTKLAVGQKNIVWRGLFMDGTKPDIIEFYKNHNRYTRDLQNMLNLFNIWMLPTNCDKRIRQRIEGAIAIHLYGQPGLVGEFQDAGIHYAKRQSNEEPIRVQIEDTKSIMGLPATLDV
jgi:hypothetical protein